MRLAVNGYQHGPSRRAEHAQDRLSQVYSQWVEAVSELEAANSLIAAQVRLIGNLTRMAIDYADQRDRARATAVTYADIIAVLKAEMIKLGREDVFDHALLGRPVDGDD